MKKPYIVYLNKSYDVWMRDAHKWAEDNNMVKDIDYQEIISEVVFWAYMDKDLLLTLLYYSVKTLLLNIKTNIMKIFGILMLLLTLSLTLSIPYQDIEWNLPRVLIISLTLILGYGLSINFLTYKR